MLKPQAQQLFAGALPEPPYERPAEEVVDSMRRHLLDEHGRRMRLRRDVAWPGNNAAEPLVTFEPANAARAARYHCSLCPPGFQFKYVGDPVRGAERRAHLRLYDQQLNALLRGLPAERHDEVIDAYDRGELMPALLDGGLARRRQQTKRNPRPAAQRRRTGAQRWMLKRYAELGHVGQTQEELEELLGEDVNARFEILGENKPRALETLKGDWGEIPHELREAAKAQSEERSERERNAERAAHLRRKLTP